MTTGGCSGERITGWVEEERELRAEEEDGNGEDGTSGEISRDVDFFVDPSIEYWSIFM